jgi:hypothetical protein
MKCWICYEDLAYVLDAQPIIVHCLVLRFMTSLFCEPTWENCIIDVLIVMMQSKGLPKKKACCKEEDKKPK